MRQQAAQAGAAAGARRGKRTPAETRRRQILESAIRLFAKRGFRGTTTREIAAAAGVNEALIFRHFATKEDLYDAIIEYKTSEADAGAWIGELESYARKRDDEGLFSAAAWKILGHYGHDLEFLQLMLYSALEGRELARMFGERLVRPVRRYLRDYVARRQREGAFRRINPDAAVRAFVGMPSHHALVKGLRAWDEAALGDRAAVAAFTRIFLDGMRCGAAHGGGDGAKGKKSGP